MSVTENSIESFILLFHFKCYNKNVLSEGLIKHSLAPAPHLGGFAAFVCPFHDKLSISGG